MQCRAGKTAVYSEGDESIYFVGRRRTSTRTRTFRSDDTPGCTTVLVLYNKQMMDRLYSYYR
eukprot:scaffold630935_cov18-Prasinocladus_malaysianus.AAC.1